MHEFIREVVLKAFGKEIAENVSILTVVLNLKNAKEIF
jgi:DNA-binding protein